MEIINFEFSFTIKVRNKIYVRRENNDNVQWFSIENNDIRLLPKEKTVILNKEFEKTLEQYYD
ncbi:hypothetical protein [Flavobacterium filum]|jgi:hypothetical protein|uniref:hypothetical protein n=1 Tax=Flavobacterium filum TaxID=370974 RepID=UPI0023F2756C|nr:hypothetical protein [Flavobacterium filum]